MKVKARKAARKVLANKQPVLYSSMKGRDEVNCLDARKTAATALITSCYKKRQAGGRSKFVHKHFCIVEHIFASVILLMHIYFSGARLALTTQVLRRSKVTEESSSRADRVLVIDSCHDLRLAFPSLDGASSDHKVKIVLKHLCQYIDLRCLCCVIRCFRTLRFHRQ